MSHLIRDMRTKIDVVPLDPKHIHTHARVHGRTHTHTQFEDCLSVQRSVRNGKQRGEERKGGLVLNKLACQQKMERRTLARKKRDGSWRAPKHRSWEMKGRLQEGMSFKLCAHLRSRKTKGAAQKAQGAQGPGSGS